MFLRRFREYWKFLKSLFQINIRLLWGMWKLTKLPHPAITIFGGARVSGESPYTAKARELAKILAGDGFSIITGGGPGIMEAANAGAIDYLKSCQIEGVLCPNEVVSAGIGLVRLNIEKKNPYVQENITMTHFFARKWLLVRYAIGFVVFPGGFGTLDELFEIITLVQCNRMARVPIILMDTNFWEPLTDWIYSRALKEGLISKEDTEIITVTDSVDQVVEKIRIYCKHCKHSLSFNGFEHDKN